MLYPSDVNEAWAELKSCLLDATDSSCGWTKGGRKRKKETWCRNTDVDKAVNEKRKFWKIWQNGGSKEDYLTAKRHAKRAVYIAKKAAQDAKFGNLDRAEQKNKLFREARKMKSENQDIVGDKCIKDDEGKLAWLLLKKTNLRPGGLIIKGC